MVHRNHLLDVDDDWNCKQGIFSLLLHINYYLQDHRGREREQRTGRDIDDSTSAA